MPGAGGPLAGAAALQEGMAELRQRVGHQLRLLGVRRHVAQRAGVEAGADAMGPPYDLEVLGQARGEPSSSSSPYLPLTQFTKAVEAAPDASRSRLGSVCGARHTLPVYPVDAHPTRRLLTEDQRQGVTATQSGNW